jgi:hypothetical protein
MQYENCADILSTGMILGYIIKEDDGMDILKVSAVLPVTKIYNTERNEQKRKQQQNKEKKDKDFAAILRSMKGA